MIPLDPHIALIDFLNSQFPPVTPDPSMSPSEIMFTAGKRYVIDWLLYELSEQHNEDFSHVHITT